MAATDDADDATRDAGQGGVSHQRIAQALAAHQSVTQFGVDLLAVRFLDQPDQELLALPLTNAERLRP